MYIVYVYNFIQKNDCIRLYNRLIVVTYKY